MRPYNARLRGCALGDRILDRLDDYDTSLGYDIYYYGEEHYFMFIFHFFVFFAWSRRSPLRPDGEIILGKVCSFDNIVLLVLLSLKDFVELTAD